MFTQTPRINFFLTGVIWLTAVIGLSGQVNSHDAVRLQRQSLASFEAGDFNKALTGFTAVHEIDPKNAMVCYYQGICLVELNKELDDAIELLYAASIKDVPADVNYYLGRAYLQDYNFSDARKYFERFEMKASRQELKSYNIKHWIRTCRSAREITSAYNPFEVMNVTFIDLSDSVQYAQVKMKGGQLQRKPAEYFTDNEDHDGLTGLMFVPHSISRGDYLYFSGYSRNHKNGAELFRVRNRGKRAWNEPEEIDALNSSGNEILPYFDPIEKDLYFASDGRPGIGGYDLFKSHYDSERDTWSEPLNMGFPVNSVMDDYLLLPGSDLGMVMFFSTREGTDSTVTVYRVHLAEPKKQTDPNDNEILKQIANLGGVASDILAEWTQLEASADAGQLNQLSAHPGTAAEKVGSGPLEEGAYQLLLAEVLKHQAASDSLKDLASQARARIKASSDPNDKWVWQKQIMLWEKKAHDEAMLAGEHYQTLEASRTQPASREPGAGIIEADTVIGEITRYRFITPAPPAPVNNFEILADSPYDRNHPIPFDVALPEGIRYMIQLGAFSEEVEPDAFQGIAPILGEHLATSDIVKYYAGKFSHYDDASTALSIVRSHGYEDAFIVAWYNGTHVPVQKAKQLE